MIEPDFSSDTHSLAPIVVQRDGLEADAAALHRGGRRALSGFVLISLAALALFVFALGDLDRRQSYLDAGQRIESIRIEGFAKFWNCALIGTPLSRVRSADDAESEITRRAEHFGPAYGMHLKRCGVNLGAMEREVGSLTVPVTLAPQVRAIEQALANTRTALDEVVAGLARVDSVDVAGAKLAVAQLALDFDELRRSHAAFRTALRKHVRMY